MSQESVEKFLGRLLTDDGFRKRAKDYLLMSCVENGYTLTESEHKILQTVDFDAFATLSNNIDREIKRYDSKIVKNRYDSANKKSREWEMGDISNSDSKR